MLTAALLLIAPVALYLLSLPRTGRLQHRLRWAYRLTGATLVFPSAAAAVYFAGYSGEQGGVAAFFIQLASLACLVLLMAVTALAQWFGRRRQ